MSALDNVLLALRRLVQSDQARAAVKYPDFEATHHAILDLVRPYSRTSPEAIYAVIEAVKYVARRRIPGAIVECGVWRGGSMMAAAKTLMDVHDTGRDLYLFDTFEGMSAPTDRDVDLTDRGAAELMARSDRQDDTSIWASVGLDDVKRSMAKVGYPETRIHYVRGKVEETLPAHAPAPIALLRLDTDWYESTRHELEHLYPRLVSGGVLLIDDYGHWKGARQATDEFIAATPDFGLLTRIDYTGRVAIKP
jgi:hypothetical protein